jgi:hypothetical protein
MTIKDRHAAALWSAAPWMWTVCWASAACGPATPASSAQSPASAAPSTGPSEAPERTSASALPAEAAAGPGESFSLVRDADTFELYVQEQKLATIEYTLEADGSYHGRASVSYAGQSFTRSFSVAVDASRQWTRIDSEAPTGNISVVRAGLAATITHAKGTRYDAAPARDPGDRRLQPGAGRADPRARSRGARRADHPGTEPRQAPG